MFTPGMLALRRASAAAAGTVYKVDGNPPETPTHLLVSSLVANSYLSIWDVTDPTSPSMTASYNLANYGPIYGGKACIKNGYAYVPSYTGDTIYVVDVSDPNTLGASQIVDTFTDVLLDAPYSCIPHPTKDIIWVPQNVNNYVHVIDISDPANLSIIDTVTVTGTQPWGADLYPGGDYFYVGTTGGTMSRYELDGSNNAINETTSAIYNQQTRGLCFQVSPIDGEHYIGSGGFSDAVNVSKLGNDATVDSNASVLSSTQYDNTCQVVAALYLPNYSTSYDNAWYYCAYNDDMIGVFAEKDGTITNLVNITSADLDACANIDAFDDYIFAGSQLGDHLGVYQWDGLNSITQVFVTYDVTILNSVSGLTLYKP